MISMRTAFVALALCLFTASALPSEAGLLANRRSGPLELAQAAESGVETLAATPWFCHDLECPAYKTVNKTDVYETRAYAPAVWASTEVSSLLYTKAVTTGFKRLFDYISGENSDNTKIPMTTPVLTAVQPTDGHVWNYTVNFYTPAKFQVTTPKPTADDVHIMTTGPHVGYVLSFGGFLVDEITLASKVKTLKEAVLADGHKIQEPGYFVASYDPPFRLTGRHNEIIIGAKIL